MQKAVIYARFSSNRQTEDSIEAQVRACSAYAANKGYNVIKQYVDEAISGKGEKTAKRTQYQRMLKDSEKRLFDVILVHKYDRVARNLAEHVNLEKKLHDNHVQIIATAQDFGDTNEAKIMRSLMWALSEYYIDNLSDEVKKGHKETALKGLHNGGYAPFGYDVVDQKYVRNEIEAGYVEKMAECALNRKGFTELIKEMAERGIKGKRGKPIKYPQIYEILRNEKYTGVYTYSTEMETFRSGRRAKPNAIRIEDALPVIIEKSKFEEIQRIMDNRKQTGKKANYLCSGLVYCECGAKMHGMRSRKKEYVYYYYTCSKKCGQPTVRMEDVDSAAVNYLHTLLSKPNQKIIADSLRKYQAGTKDSVATFDEAIKSKVSEKQKEYDALMGNLSSDTLPAEVVKDIGIKMQTLKNEITALQETPPPPDFTVDQIKVWLEAIKAAPDEKAIHLLIERIDIKNKTEINIQSTLTSVLSENGRGDRI